jgi:hypothetical protein
MSDIELLLSSEFSGHGAKKLLVYKVSDEGKQLRSDNNRKWWAENHGSATYDERCKNISAAYKKYIKEHGAVRTGAVLSDETKLKISKSNIGIKTYGKNGRARAVRTPLGVFDTLTRAAEAHGFARASGGAYIRKRIKAGVPGYEYV